jgi:hypothetical protein
MWIAKPINVNEVIEKNTQQPLIHRPDIRDHITFATENEAAPVFWRPLECGVGRSVNASV